MTSGNEEAADGVARFQIVHQIDGRYYWELIDPDGTPAARSTDSYASEDEAVAAAERAQRVISQARVVRS